MESPDLRAQSAPAAYTLAGAGAVEGHRAVVLAPSSLIVPLFAATMFLSGFLLFVIEPMVARMVLPIFGGVPMVWNGCVVFFQMMMLAGYGYAYGTSHWIPVRRHVFVHAALLVAPALVLPVAIGASPVETAGSNQLVTLILLLAASIGLPFFVLSTSASVLQHWLSRTDHPAGRDPYFLYSASNLGCLLALASYPTIIEPMMTLREQARLWSIGYAECAILICACAFVAWRRHKGTEPALAVAQGAGDAVAAPIAGIRRLRWIALAFIPSSLMLAITSYVSTDIAAVPLLWIVPLALYLLTFTIAFGKHASAASALARRALPMLAVPLALLMITKLRAPLSAVVALHLAAFGVMALNCHADLSKDRPDSSRLTEFYFWISLGGMLGGLFNTLAAPLLFDRIIEYPVVVILACLLFRSSDAGEPWRPKLADVAVPLGVAAVTAAILVKLGARADMLGIEVAALSVPAVITYAQRRHSTRFGYCMTALLVMSIAFGTTGERVLYATRTFFGVYRVSEDPSGQYHGLAHGTTLHGMQALESARRGEALTYFHRTGPFGQAWNTLPALARARNVAVVGLGVGTLAAYASPGQRWTFFEIDPVIEQIARDSRYFSFMEACGDRCRVVLGDARLSLNREPEQAYDLLVLDAFSSDSIPIHLLTREAVGLYLSRLKPDGVLVMHVSNRHLRLAPIVARLAESQSLTGLQQIDRIGPNWPAGKTESHWIVMSRNAADLDALHHDSRWTSLEATPSAPLWTDDFSNILSVLIGR